MDSWVGKIPWRRERLPNPVFWPGKFHGLYSPWGHKESDMTWQLKTIKADQEEAAWQWRADFLSLPVFIMFLELVPQLGNGSKSSAYEYMNPSALMGTTMHFSEMILAGHVDLC